MKDNLILIESIENTKYYKDSKTLFLYYKKTFQGDINSYTTVLELIPPVIKIFVEYLSLVKEASDKNIKTYEYLNTLPLEKYEKINKDVEHIVSKYHEKNLYLNDESLDIDEYIEDIEMLKVLKREENLKLVYKTYDEKMDTETYILYSFDEGFLKIVQADFYLNVLDRRKKLKKLDIIPITHSVAKDIVVSIFKEKK